MVERTVKTTLIASAAGYIDAFGKAQKATRELGSEAEKLAQKQQAFEQLGRAGFAVGALAAAGVAVAASKFADFDQAMSNVKAATQETAGNMALLREAALDAGGETVFSAVEAANAVEELGKAGLSTADILEGGLAGSLDLAAAGQIRVGRAAEITAITLKQFGLTGKRATDVADLLAAGAGKAAGGVEDLAQAMNQSALVAAQVGLSVEETTGVLSAFASAGLLGSDAGTSLKSALQRLTPQSKEAEREMARLGISAFDAQGNFIGAANLAGVLQDSLGDLTVEQRNASLAVIFGSDAVRAAGVLYAEGADGIQEWIDKADDSGFAARVAADRLDNLKGDVEKLGGAFDSTLIKSGGAANEMLRGLVQGATFLVDAVGDLPKPVLEGGLAVTTMGAAIALTGGAAMTAIPQIAAYKAGLSALGVTAKTAGLAVGLVGGALGLAAIAVSAFVAEQAAAKARTEAFTDSLDQATGAVSDYTEELVKKRLREAGAFEDAKKYGITQQELTEAVIEGGKALDLVEEKLAATSEGLVGQQKRAADVGSEYSATARAIRGTSGELEDAREAFRKAESATEDNEVALREMQDATAAAEQAVEDLSDTLSNFGKVELDARAASRELEQAIDDATAAFVENGASLDIGTEAGRNNQAALDGIAQAANDAAAAIYDQTGSIEDASVALDTGRAKYVAVGIQMGLTRDQAEKYADALIATPAAVQTQVKLTGVEAAKARLAGLAAAYKVGGSVSLRAVVEADRRPNANGNIYSYSRGGFGEGMYSGGTPLYKFAEPETRWEAFISGRPGMEDRNRALVREAGARLGMGSSSQSGPVSVSLAGARISLEVGGRQIEGVIREQIVQQDRAEASRLGMGWSQ